MNVKQKFFAISGVAGLIMAIVSIVGYFTASDAVKSTVEKQIAADVRAEVNDTESWLLEKVRLGQGTVSILAHLPASQEAMARSHEILMAGADDKEVKNFINVMENGYCMTLENGDQTGKSKWQERDWYRRGMASGKIYRSSPQQVYLYVRSF